MNAAAFHYAADVLLRPDGSLAVVFLVPAWHAGPAQLAVWCPVCGGLHYHGRTARDDLHRVSHCVAVAPGTYQLRPMPGAAPPRRPAVLADVAHAAQVDGQRRIRSMSRRGR